MDQQLKTILFKSFEVKQPIGVFYVGFMNYKDLIRLSYADVRRLEKEEREVETYIGIQRPLSPSRVKEIGKYVNLVDATFPTSVILHANEGDVSYDPESQTMKISDREDVLKVLDGQHRIAGLERCQYNNEDFQINITLFVGMELEDQAIIFATINKSHTKVNKSLVADLFDFAKARSPQKTAHVIVRALNEKEGSPFKEKIKILGTANNKEKETITQATFVDGLMKYISRDPMLDRDIYRRGKTPEPATPEESKKLFFRNLFIDEEDTKIAQILWNYFSAVQMKWPLAWNEVKAEMVLNRSTGFIALMRFLGSVYPHFNRIGEIVTTEEFSSVFSRINIPDNSFTKTEYLPGGSGQRKLYEELRNKSNL